MAPCPFENLGRTLYKRVSYPSLCYFITGVYGCPVHIYTTVEGGGWDGGDSSPIVSNTCNIMGFWGKSKKEIRGKLYLNAVLMPCDYLCLFLPTGGMRGGRKVIVEPHKHKGKLLSVCTSSSAFSLFGGRRIELSICMFSGLCFNIF